MGAPSPRHPAPGARLAVVRLALAAAPLRALRGLGWVLRGKRVRGWNLLTAAAADHPDCYARWIRAAEPRIMREFRAGRARNPHGPIASLILGGAGDAASAATLASVRGALGPETIVLTDIPSLVAGGAILVDPDTSFADALTPLDPAIRWLLPLHAGTTVSTEFSDILDHAGLQSDDTVIYWDEDAVHDGWRTGPCIKPDWDPLLLAAADGVTGAALISLVAARNHAAGAFGAAGVERTVIDLLADDSCKVRHIPLILTHRGGTCVAETEQRRIVPASLGVAPVEPATWPSVTIIIPTRDRADLLSVCLGGLKRLTYRGAVEIVIVDNDSIAAETAALFATLASDPRVTVLRHPGAFTFAAMVNRAAAIATGEMLCLLNNDIEPRDGEWLAAMVRHALAEDAGAVGARLLYPDGTVQHCGVAIGIGGAAGHVQKGVDPADPRFAAWHSRTRRVAAVTAACLVIARTTFVDAGGMDAEGFAVDFNDVDLCLRLQDKGLHNVILSEATLIHHESTTRGRTRSQREEARFARELGLLRSRWQTEMYLDPRHSALFRRESERCLLRF